MIRCETWGRTRVVMVVMMLILVILVIVVMVVIMCGAPDEGIGVIFWAGLLIVMIRCETFGRTRGASWRRRSTTSSCWGGTGRGGAAWRRGARIKFEFLDKLNKSKVQEAGAEPQEGASQDSGWSFCSCALLCFVVFLCFVVEEACSEQQECC